MLTADIQIRDPFVLPVAPYYYLYGTTDPNCWAGAGEGFNAFRSPDLENWEGPFPIFRASPTFWGTMHFWAPEVHAYAGRYYLFASFKAPQRYRATQILVADQPEGPFEPLIEGPSTPANWECLDGTLYVDEQRRPWLVFCHEWVQVHNGAMYALPLSADLKQPAGRPVFLFSASEAPWVKPFAHPHWSVAPGGPLEPFPCYVTDGPWLHRTAAGQLLMLWSSGGHAGYTLGVARSLSGLVTGPWEQQATPLYSQDGGHGMLFRTFEGQLRLVLHAPNATPLERARILPVEETEAGLRLV